MIRSSAANCSRFSAPARRSRPNSALALACALLVLVRWPTEGVGDLSGARSLQVLRVFGYGLLAGVLLLVPGVPGDGARPRAKVKGTLALLLNSPLSAGVDLRRQARRRARVHRPCCSS